MVFVLNVILVGSVQGEIGTIRDLRMMRMIMISDTLGGEDEQFVREPTAHKRRGIRRLISLLIEAEAMREKAEFANWHDPWRKHFFKGRVKRPNPHYGWTDSDWIEAKRKELMG